jgi:hypothetical protein
MKMPSDGTAGPRPGVLVLAVVVLLMAVWASGWLVTRLGAWQAPWIVPSGIALSGEPDIGVSYNVEIYTHCGLRHVEFDGDRWGISGVLSDGHANPPPGFGNPVDRGTITLTSSDTADYHSSFGEQRQLTRGDGLTPVAGCL